MKAKILSKQTVGDLEITEMADPNLFDGEPCFEVRTKSRVNHVRIYPTLDMALIGGLALKYDGGNTQAARGDGQSSLRAAGSGQRQR